MINTRATAFRMVAPLVLGWSLVATPSGAASLKAVPAKASLDAITLTAFHRFEAANRAGGMIGLTDAVRGCYGRAAASPVAVMQCLQLDWFARTYDIAFVASVAKDADAAERLRTPYFADEPFKARRDVHLQDAAGDQSEELDASLLIHARNTLAKELGSK